MPDNKQYGPTMSLDEVRDALGIRPTDLERLFADRGHPVIEDAMGEPAVDAEHAAALIAELRENRRRKKAARRAYEAYVEEQARNARLERLAAARNAFEKARQRAEKADAAWRTEQARKREAKAAELQGRRRQEWEAAGSPKSFTDFLKDYR